MEVAVNKSLLISGIYLIFFEIMLRVSSMYNFKQEFPTIHFRKQDIEKKCFEILYPINILVT